MCEHARPYILFYNGTDLAVSHTQLPTYLFTYSINPSSSLQTYLPTDLQAQVAISKFQVAAILASLGIDYLFIELDVWLVRNPLPLFATDERAEIFIGGHFNSPGSLNIGFYYVKVVIVGRNNHLSPAPPSLLFGLCVFGAVLSAPHPLYLFIHIYRAQTKPRRCSIA